MLESYLISVAMKSTVVLAAGMLCLRLLRGRDAAVRHLVCLTALASAAAVPLLAVWSPQWSILISVPAGSTGAGSGIAKPGSRPVDLADVARGHLGAWHRGHDGPRSRRMDRAVARSPPIDAFPIWRRRRSPDRERELLRSLAASCDPLILLPENARDWDEARLRAVLLHEAAHVRRRDCLAKYLAQGSRALLWWNPLAWMVAARLNHEQELACDDAVLAAGVPADAYATVLLDVARECSSSLVLGCAMDRRTHFARALCPLIRMAPGNSFARRAGPPLRFRCCWS